MKKKIIIIAGAVLLVAAGLAFYFLYPYLKKTDLSKYVPKNSFAVMKWDLANMGSKLNFDELGEMSGMKNEFLNNLEPSQREAMDKIMKNPLKAGFDFKAAPIAFLYEEKQTNNLIAGLVIGLNDRKDFNDLLNSLNPGLSIEGPDKDGFYQIRDVKKNATFFFNDKVGLLLAGDDLSSGSLQGIRDNLVEQEKEKSILANEDYNKLAKEANDVLLYLNKTEIENFVSSNANKKLSSGEESSVKEGINSLPKALALNFNEDQIAIKTYEEGGSTKFFKESGLEEKELQNLSQDGSPLAYMTMNLDILKSLDLISSINRAANADDLSINESLDDLANGLTISKSELLNMMSGKMSLSFSGVKREKKMVMEPEYDALYDEINYVEKEVLTTVPLVTFWAGVKNEGTLRKVMELLAENYVIYDEDGSSIYKLKEGDNDPDIYLIQKNNDLFISTDRDALSAKLGSNNWRSLPDDMGKADAKENPALFFVDLRLKKYERLIKDFADVDGLVQLDKLKDAISRFENIQFKHGKGSSQLTLNFSPQKKNGLQQLLMIANDLWKLSS